MSSNPRILLAEDTDVNARLLIAVLEKAGYEVTLAVDGVQAVKYGEIGDFDLILMDVNMPDLDGLAGMNGCLSKPIQMATLLKACERSLAKSTPKSA